MWSGIYIKFTKFLCVRGFHMSRFSRFSVLCLSLMAFSIHAGNSVKSYPAGLCSQSVGPENSLLISAVGDVVNTNQNSEVSVLCPVVLETTAVTELQATVTLRNEFSATDKVTCQLASTSFGSQIMSYWGNTASSTQEQGVQSITSRISAVESGTGERVKAFVSCTLPAANESNNVALLSYQVTETFN